MANPPKASGIADELRQLISDVHGCRELWDVNAMAAHRGVSVRTNQRHFMDFVGVTSKWTAQRYRIQAAIDQLDAGRLRAHRECDLTALALDLGYFDIRHFSNDFKVVTGYSPADYRKPKGLPIPFNDGLHGSRTTEARQAGSSICRSGMTFLDRKMPSLTDSYRRQPVFEPNSCAIRPATMSTHGGRRDQGDQGATGSCSRITGERKCPCSNARTRTCCPSSGIMQGKSISGNDVD